MHVKQGKLPLHTAVRGFIMLLAPQLIFVKLKIRGWYAYGERYLVLFVL